MLRAHVQINRAIVFLIKAKAAVLHCLCTATFTQSKARLMKYVGSLTRLPLPFYTHTHTHKRSGLPSLGVWQKGAFPGLRLIFQLRLVSRSRFSNTPHLFGGPAASFDIEGRASTMTRTTTGFSPHPTRREDGNKCRKTGR